MLPCTDCFECTSMGTNYWWCAPLPAELTAPSSPDITTIAQAWAQCGGALGQDCSGGAPGLHCSTGPWADTQFQRGFSCLAVNAPEVWQCVPDGGVARGGAPRCGARGGDTHPVRVAQGHKGELFVGSDIRLQLSSHK